ncbi:hypothetical protein HMPREF1155_1813 [Slackia sp. CM382]|nr:hypothetical protein HMPREF1155_1813 [Slackia sp. CM382]
MMRVFEDLPFSIRRRAGSEHDARILRGRHPFCGASAVCGCMGRDE